MRSALFSLEPLPLKMSVHVPENNHVETTIADNWIKLSTGFKYTELILWIN